MKIFFHRNKNIFYQMDFTLFSINFFFLLFLAVGSQCWEIVIFQDSFFFIYFLIKRQKAVWYNTFFLFHRILYCQNQIASRCLLKDIGLWRDENSLGGMENYWWSEKYIHNIFMRFLISMSHLTAWTREDKKKPDKFHFDNYGHS